MTTSLARVASSRSTSRRNLLATASSASTGHFWNQSMVQQLTSDGFWRSRSRKAPPMGDMQKTMCR